MQPNIQGLIDKVYSDGVEKANQEAENIIAEAKKKAEEIAKLADEEAESVISNAVKEAEELKKNTLSEIKLSSNQALSSVKQDVANLIQGKVLDAALKDAFSDKEFLTNSILSIISNWNPKAEEAVDISVLLPEEKQEELLSFLSTEIKKTVDSGVELSTENKIYTGFKIGPLDGGYHISFTDEDFKAFFKNFLRPRLVELLFG